MEDTFILLLLCVVSFGFGLSKFSSFVNFSSHYIYMISNFGTYINEYFYSSFILVVSFWSKFSSSHLRNLLSENRN